MVDAGERQSPARHASDKMLRGSIADPAGGSCSEVLGGGRKRQSIGVFDGGGECGDEFISSCMDVNSVWEGFH